MKPSKTDILICNKRELNSKVSYWENQKRKAEKQLQKLQAEIKELEKEIAKEKLA
jgi:predicted  nucleic acid-binding Zn-ribbon protein